MRNSLLLFIFIAAILGFSLLAGCNPYKGFKGVEKKGMSNNKPPSQELREDYEKLNKKARKAYKKEMKRRKKQMGTQDGKRP